ncbi:hypothetical protein A6V37_25760 [Paraburkholderia ginsengiterrae]|uniref:Uncharacterized protein n=1 Tax=Paraburkholderia ginsengiterrae TaxID=1462993 RepID=A0A1A9N8G3_9BURK|nr:hypothetical protein A6V37_25760 [Paraburkholderia ginsengiterrae]
MLGAKTSIGGSTCLLATMNCAPRYAFYSKATRTRLNGLVLDFLPASVFMIVQSMVTLREGSVFLQISML